MDRLEACTCTDPPRLARALHLEQVPREALHDGRVGEVMEVGPRILAKDPNILDPLLGKFCTKLVEKPWLPR